MSKHAISNGIKGGLTIAVLSLLSFFLYDNLVAMMLLMLVFTVIKIVFMVRSAKAERAANDGVISFGGAFGAAAAALIIILAIQFTVQVISFQIAGDSYVEKVIDSSLENTASIMQWTGAPDSQIDAQLDAMEEEMPAQFTIAGMTMSTIWSLVRNLIIALIIGAIVKREEKLS